MAGIDKRGASHIALWTTLISAFPIISWLVAPHVVSAEEFDQLQQQVVQMKVDINDNKTAIDKMYMADLKRDLRNINLRIAKLESKTTLEEHEREELSLLRSTRTGLLQEIREAM